MSDRPRPESDSGWFTPENATSNFMSQPSAGAQVPLPGTTPSQAGAWHIPASSESASSDQSASSSSPQGAAPYSDVDYDNYVPGVGFVPKTQAAQSAAQPPAESSPTMNAQPPEPAPTPAPTLPTPGGQAPTLADIPIPGTPAPMSSQPAQPAAEADDDKPNIGAAAPLPAIPGLQSPGAPAPQPTVQPTPQPAQSTPVPQATGTPAPAKADAAPIPQPISADEERSASEKEIQRPVPQAQPAQQASSPAQSDLLTSDQLANEPLQQRYTDVEQAVQALRRRYSVGRMTRDQLQTELRKLMILDDDGNWWMIGLESDRWYKYNGRDWLPADPPGRTSGPDRGITGRGSGATNLGKPLLGKPVVKKGDTQAIEPNRYDIPVDEYGMPLPQRVPVNDLGATMVGRTASRFDEGVEPYDSSGPTVPMHSLDVTQPGATVASPSVAGGVAVPAPGIQPNYGPAPQGFSANRHRMGRILVIGALVSTFLVLAATLLVVIGSVLYYSSIVSQYSTQIDNLPQAVQATSQSIQIFDINGSPLSTVNDPNFGKRIYVTLDNISPDMIAATVATENSRFYSDPGFDVVSIARAVLGNLFSKSQTTGASTITQQLTRALILEQGAANERTSERKIREIIVSSEVARRYTKSQIMEYYLNTVYYGNLAYGVEAAAQTYFGKSAKNLNKAESAFLAGLVQAPATYDPAVNPTASFNRMDEVLTLMGNLGCIQMEHGVYASAPYCITKNDITQLAVLIAQVKAKVATFKPVTNGAKYPHFLNYVLQQLEDTYGKDQLYRSGYRVYTTIDPSVQDIAQTAVTNQISRLGNLNVHDAAVLAMNPDGAVVAMVGSADFNSSDPRVAGQVNVTLAPRQPGSSIKPFVYYAALDRNKDKNNVYWTPATVIWDVPTCFPPNNYCPTNYDNLFHGPQTVRYALANSLNIPAVKTLDFVGIDRFTTYAKNFGLSFPSTQPQDAGLSMALGGIEVRMIDMVRGYSVFANQGKLVTPYSITKILSKDSNGNDVTVFDIKANPPQPQQVADPAITYLITNILSDNNARSLEFGLNSPLRLPGDRPAAVKTGTTNNFKDNWTIGFTPQLIVGVWVGNADGEAMVGTTGITGAAPIWHDVMSQVLASKPVMQFPVPPNIQQANICADFGTIDFEGCQNKRQEIFYAPNPIAQPGDIFQRIQIDTFTGQKATAACQDMVQEKLFLKIDDPTAINWINNTPEGQAFAAKYQLDLPLTQPPTGDCDPNIPRPNVKVASPQPNSTVLRGPVEIRGTVIMSGLQAYEIDVAPGTQPKETDYQKVGGPYGPPPGENAFLGSWDASTVNPGQYTLRLRAIDNQNRHADVIIPLTVSDSLPTSAAPGQDTTQTAPLFGVTATPVPTSGFSIFVTDTPAPAGSNNSGFPTMTPIVINPAGPTNPPAPTNGPTPTKPLFAPTFTPNP